MMSEQIMEMIRRIKEMRELSDLSVERVANLLAIPVEQYEQYEQGTTDIPIGVLYKLSNIFNVELNVLLTGDDAKLHTYCLVRKGKGVPVNRHREYRFQDLAFNFSNRAVEPLYVEIDPDMPPVPHNHAGQEFDYIIEGRMKLTLHDKELILNEGDSIIYDSGYSHGMQALDDKPVKFIAIVVLQEASH
ncbi:helix-turn-helix domain-containing protein [Luoshenia tenuis]|jgi:quercetin dioxygenase-like cupin family protein|nr:DNA-binding transcriptional repressor PuuR [uncultured Clostridium sp.]